MATSYNKSRWYLLSVLTVGLVFLLSGCGDKQTAAESKSENKDVSSSGTTVAGAERPTREARSIADLIKEAELDKDKQKFIWDAEHMTFLIEAHFGKPLMGDIANGTVDSFESWLTDDFEGSHFVDGWQKTVTHIGITEKRRGEGHSMEKAGGMQMVEEMKEHIADFKKMKKVKFQLLKIWNPSKDLKNWDTLAYVNFIGSSAEGKPLEYLGIHRFGVQIEDFSNAKEQVIAGHNISSWKIEKEVFRTAGGSLMKEITSNVGLDQILLDDNWTIAPDEADQYRFQMAISDFNMDGWLDVVVFDGEKPPLMYANQGGEKFIEVSKELGVKEHMPEDPEGAPFSYMTGFIDYDNDGDPDLLAGHRFYRNDGDRFVDVTKESNLTFRQEPMGLTPIDYDLDGDLDLYVLYQSAPEEAKKTEHVPWVGDNEGGGLNILWQNQGDGSFVDVTLESNAGGGLRHSFAATWFFYDDDHFPDVYIANDFGENMLLRNKGDGTFEDVTIKSGSGDYATSMGVSSGDLDNDGHDELYVANMFSKMGRRIIEQIEKSDYPEGIYEQIVGSCAGNRLYRMAGPDDPFKDLSEDLGINGVGWAYAPAMVDVDQDGLLDLYAATGFLSFERGKPDG